MPATHRHKNGESLARSPACSLARARGSRRCVSTLPLITGSRAPGEYYFRGHVSTAAKLPILSLTLVGFGAEAGSGELKYICRGTQESVDVESRKFGYSSYPSAHISSYRYRGLTLSCKTGRRCCQRIVSACNIRRHGDAARHASNLRSRFNRLRGIYIEYDARGYKSKILSCRQGNLSLS